MITTTLRIDEETYNELVKLAQKEERSINSYSKKIFRNQWKYF